MNSAKFGSRLLLLVLHFIIVQSKRIQNGDGYKKVDNYGYYKLHTHLKTWEKAEKICESEGAKLAVLNSQEEANILMDLWDESPPVDPDNSAGKFVYLGFHDRIHEGEFETIFKEPLHATGFAVWGHGEPNNFDRTDEDCGTLDVRTKTLNDISCECELRFLCEKRKNRSSSFY